jgi:ABC-type amino acid transport substrate-binding protein
LLNGTIDAEMGSTTYTQKREQVADFSLIFFFSETTSLVAEDSGIKTLSDLSGKRVGGAQATTNLMAVQEPVKDGKFSPSADVVTEIHPQGMLALKSGKIDAYTTDRSLLEGLKTKDCNRATG